MKVLILSLSPVFIILTYVWFRDKYEKEPVSLLVKSLVAGGLMVIPVMVVETLLTALKPAVGELSGAGYTAFVVAGFTEELFKFLALYILVWKNPNFNEKFDGIVYAVFVSLGFAAVENVMYVASGGVGVALTRALTAVPAHALFGITMGYYLGIAHMVPHKRHIFLRKAFIIPFLLHGAYDFILLSQVPLLLTLFIPFMLGLYFSGFKRMKIISDASIFKKDVTHGEL
ncbi:MAG TPA: PrsW family glutamic-type intramembrane protease [Bacteroidales bacterium]|nr:PrsW family glutamic-type intramembrane protease [Bacteroidales bacterium]